MRGEGPIYVGVLILDLEMGWVRSLKEKRALLRPLTERLRVRFPVSVARLDGLDSHVWERIGATAISNDPIWLRDLFAKVEAFAASAGVVVAGSRLEIEPWARE